MLDFLFPDPYGKPHAGSTVPGTFPDPSADRGKSDLSSCGGRFCGTSVHMGAGGCYSGRQPDGTCGYADLYPDSVRDLYSFPGVGICPPGQEADGNLITFISRSGEYTDEDQA